jgi:SfnB family sulfur acquisition oxidoreductase
MARILRDDREALDVASELAERFAPGASERDQARRLPVAELEELSASGLLAISVPRSHGGAGASYETITEVFRRLSVADSSIGQIPQNHFVFVDVLTLDGTPAQKSFFYAELLAGKRFGNALSEVGTKHVFDLKTRLTRAPDGGYRLNGRKFYCTGALFAHWVPVFTLDEQERVVVAYVERSAPGVTVIDDWSGMGQRTTASGTTLLEDVHVAEDRVVPHYANYARPQIFGAFGQILHAAIDVGIAEAALRDAREFVTTKSRPWFESGLDRASDEQGIIRSFGALVTKLHAAQALLARAGGTLDESARNVTTESAARASLAVAEAKAFAGDTAVEIANELFALAGTSATLAKWNLDRHWRNARTHSLHDPSRWKLHHIGNAYLNRVPPPNHGLL